MGIPTNIKTLLAGDAVEWARIEFKETWDAEASLKTICAFANDIDNWGGGYLVIGVKDEKGKPAELKGVAPTAVDGYLKDMLNKCKLIQPEYMPVTEVVDYKGKKFILVWAPGGTVRPYSSPKSMAKGEKQRFYYIRKMASTVAPTAEELRDLYALANNVPFDDRVNHEAELDDLNITLIKSYLKEVGSSLYDSAENRDFAELCRDMQIISTLPEYTKPRNVGLLFFNMEPDRFFPYAQIDVVQFPDGLGGDRIIENTFKGPLHQQLRDALLFIKNSVIQEKVVKVPDKAEANRYCNYPYTAVEEALSNAVYHKGYDVREPIEVRILPDRMEILSHPGADRSITQQNLNDYRAFSRRYRNRRIGEFLKELHLTEGRNTGFQKIINALEKNGSPKPLFETDDDRTFFATTLYIHPGFLARETENVGENVGDVGENVGGFGENVGDASENVGGFGKNVGGFGKNVGDASENKQALRRERIVQIIKDNPMISQKQLAGMLEVTKKTVERDIGAMKELGILCRVGEGKSGRWIVISE